MNDTPAIILSEAEGLQLASSIDRILAEIQIRLYRMEELARQAAAPGCRDRGSLEEKIMTLQKQIDSLAEDISFLLP